MSMDAIAPEVKWAMFRNSTVEAGASLTPHPTKHDFHIEPDNLPASEVHGISAQLNGSVSTGLYLTYSNRQEMLDWLKHAGLDTAEVKDAAGEDIADFIVAKKKQREADGSMSHPGLSVRQAQKTKETAAHRQADQTHESNVHQANDIAAQDMEESGGWIYEDPHREVRNPTLPYQLPVPRTLDFHVETIADYAPTPSGGSRPILSSYKQPTRRKAAHLDIAWTKVSNWLGHSNKDEMLDLLEKAGVDIAELRGQTAIKIAEFIIARRKERAGRGAAMENNLANQETDTDTTSTSRADSENKQNSIDAIVKDQRDHISEVSEAPPTSITPRYSVQEARSYLFAIKQQFRIDTEAKFFKEDEQFDLPSEEPDPPQTYTRHTFLYNEENTILFSFETQTLVHQILRYRDIVRYWAYPPRTLGETASEDLNSARKAHAELCRNLVAEVAGRIKRGVYDGQVEAMQLVSEIFGIAHKSEVGLARLVS